MAFMIGWFVEYSQFMGISNPFVLLFLYEIRCPVNAQWHPVILQVMNLIGDVKGKVAVMLDDMIDTAGESSLYVKPWIIYIILEIKKGWKY